MIDYLDSLRAESLQDSHGHTITVGAYAADDDGRYLLHMLSPWSADGIVYNLERHGNAVTYVAEHRPSAHHVIGCGAGHDDATFCETGRSHAAHRESLANYGGPWWQRRPLAGRDVYDSFRAEYEAACAARLQRGVERISRYLGAAFGM